MWTLNSYSYFGSKKRSSDEEKTRCAPVWGVVALHIQNYLEEGTVSACMHTSNVNFKNVHWVKQNCMRSYMYMYCSVFFVFCIYFIHLFLICAASWMSNDKFALHQPSSPDTLDFLRKWQMKDMGPRQTIRSPGLPFKIATPLFWQGAQRHGLTSARYSDRALFRFLFRIVFSAKSLGVTSSNSGWV